MSVDQKTIAVGKCYRTATEQHRRVYAISGSDVTYESWGGNVGNHTGHLNRDTVSIEDFANAVEEEIACPAGMNPLP